MRCHRIFLLLQSLLQALCGGFVPPPSTKLGGTAGSGGSGHGCWFYGAARSQSTRRCVILPPVTT